MAWGRLALLQVATAPKAVRDKTADVFSYVNNAEITQRDDKTDGQATTAKATKKVSTTAAQAVRKPAHFLRVNKKQRLNSSTHQEKPRYLTDPESHVLEKSVGSYRFPLATPLLSSAQLLPFLFNALSTERPTCRIDHQHLLRDIEKGKPLNKSPYVKQLRWAQQVMIIVDVSAHLEPYWVDFSQIVKQITTVLGQEAVTAIRFDELSLEDAIPYYTVWSPDDDEEAYHRWQAPAADVPILMLSDLGIADPQHQMFTRWQRFFKSLQRQNNSWVTLSPVAQSPYHPLFCQQLKPTPLNDQHALPRNPYCYGFQLDSVGLVDKIDRIICFLSVLPLVDSALLRRLRCELQWGGSELEGMIWNHSAVYETGLGIRLYETEAERYRKKYKQLIDSQAGREEATRFWDIVHHHHQHAFAGLKRLEKLNQCVLEQTYDEVLEDYLKQFCVSLSRTDKGNVQHHALLLQGRTFLDSLPEAVWLSGFTDSLHTLYALVNKEDIQAGKWPDTLPAGLEQNKIKWSVDAENRHVEQSWLLIQQGDQAEFSFIEAEKRTEFMMPIAEFTEIKGLSPTLKEKQSETIRSLKAGRLYDFSGQDAVLTLRSTTYHLDLEAIQKPTWAQGIGQNKQGLYVTVSWLGQTLIFPWQVATDNTTAGQWQWQAPFGEDEYGVYVDLTLEGITQRFRWIEPTTFMMGSPEDEVGRYDDEILHQVTLTQGYWLAETTVTQALWQAVMGDNPSDFTPEKTGLNSTENHPVEQVSWDDCQRFIDTVKQKFPQLNCRLPTEAEWENACQAGTNSPFNFAGELDVAKVNYSGCFDKKEFDKKSWGKAALQRTAAVKTYPSNAWGLYEMHGNVWEWCEDFWEDNLGTELVIDPKGAKEGTERVLRGGGWNSIGGHVRSAMRRYNSPDSRDFNFGLRLALGHPSYSQHHQQKPAKTSRADTASGQTGARFSRDGQH